MRRLLLILLLLALPLAAQAGPWSKTVLLVAATDNVNTQSFSCTTPGVVSVLVPTITSATITLAVSEEGSTWLNYNYQAGAAAAPALWQIAAGTANAVYELPPAACAFPFLRFTFGAAQSNKTLKVYGRE